jgi:hypothetical protein
VSQSTFLTKSTFVSQTTFLSEKTFVIKSTTLPNYRYRHIPAVQASSDCTAFSSYLGFFELYSVQCCADVHFFDLIRTDIRKVISRRYGYNFPSNPPVAAKITSGYREIATPGTLGNLAYRFGITLSWDPSFPYNFPYVLAVGAQILRTLLGIASSGYRYGSPSMSPLLAYCRLLTTGIMLIIPTSTGARDLLLARQ